METTLKLFVLKLQDDSARVRRVYMYGASEDEVLSMNGAATTVLSINQATWLQRQLCILIVFFLPQHRLSVRVKLAFMRGLVELLESNFTLMQAFNVLSTSTKNLCLKKWIYYLKTEVSSGYEFSAVLENMTLFTPSEIPLIKVGERLNRLASVLSSILSYRAVRQRTKMGAAVAIFLLLGLNVVIFFSGFYLAQDVGQFVARDAWFQGYQIPDAYKLMLAIYGNDVLGYLKVGLIVLGAYLLLKTIAMRIPLYRRMVANILRFVPYFRETIRLTELVNFMLALSLACEVKLPFHSAVHFAANAVKNVFYYAQVRKLSEQVNSGADFNTVISDKTLFHYEEAFLLKNALSSGDVGGAAIEVREYAKLKMHNRIRISSTMVRLFLLGLMLMQVSILAIAYIRIYFMYQY